MNKYTYQRRAGGFSVVELMVSVVVGMIAIMFATRLLATSEQNKSAALGGSDTMQNGMLALFSMNLDAQQAGWGLNDTLVNGCNTLMNDADGYQLPAIKRGGVDATPLAPVTIIANPDRSDVISLNSGSSMTGVGNVTLAEMYAGGDQIRITTNNPFGFNPGDAILVVPEPAGGDCSLAQLSAVNMDLLSITGGRFNSGGGLLGGIYNQGGAKARVFNLGPVDKLALHTWSVEKGVLKLRASNLQGSAAAAQPVVDNVVAIKGQYGFDMRPNLETLKSLAISRWSSDMIDANGNGVVGDAEDFQRVSAVRLAVIARSQVPEKPDAETGECQATTQDLTVFASATPQSVAASPVKVKLDIEGDTMHWTCYRYKAFETLVQIRNNAWRN